MKSPLIFTLWRHPLPSVAAIATAAAIFLWPAVPLAGLDNWLFIYLGTTYLMVLYPIVAALSGLFVGLVVYHKKVAPGCAVEGAKLGVGGSTLGIVFGVCPACIPTIAVFLPLAFNVFLSRVAPVLSFVAIAVLLFVIYRLKGFRRSALPETATGRPSPASFVAGGDGP